MVQLIDRIWDDNIKEQKNWANTRTTRINSRLAKAYTKSGRCYSSMGKRTN